MEKNSINMEFLLRNNLPVSVISGVSGGIYKVASASGILLQVTLNTTMTVAFYAAVSAAAGLLINLFIKYIIRCIFKQNKEKDE